MPLGHLVSMGRELSASGWMFLRVMSLKGVPSVLLPWPSLLQFFNHSLFCIWLIFPSAEHHISSEPQHFSHEDLDVQILTCTNNFSKASLFLLFSFLSGVSNVAVVRTSEKIWSAFMVSFPQSDSGIIITAIKHISHSLYWETFQYSAFYFVLLFIKQRHDTEEDLIISNIRVLTDFCLFLIVEHRWCRCTSSCLFIP